MSANDNGYAAQIPHKFPIMVLKRSVIMKTLVQIGSICNWGLMHQYKCYEIYHYYCFFPYYTNKTKNNNNNLAFESTWGLEIVICNVCQAFCKNPTVELQLQCQNFSNRGQAWHFPNLAIPWGQTIIWIPLTPCIFSNHKKNTCWELSDDKYI